LNKLAKLIENLSREDLLKIKKDIISGNVDRLIERRLQEHNQIILYDKQCPVCSGEISQDAFILEFGAPYLRRRAYFDAADCLEYFVNNQLKHPTNKEKT
jgi:hypothetical protein